MDNKYILACIVLMYTAAVDVIFRGQYALGGFQIIMGLALTNFYSNKK